VEYFINTLPGNTSLNMIRACNSRASCVFCMSGSWRRIGDVTHQQHMAVTLHVSCMSVSLQMWGDITQQQ
jgi:hypothetical protein